MRVRRPLPSPTATALEHSSRLLTEIHRAIRESHSSISFHTYMQMALYQPGLGYYVAGKHKLGSQGDFITAPEISPLFSRCVANQCDQLLNILANGCILEIGAGSGRMAADILQHLEKLDNLPTHYYILEVSPDLRQQQLDTLKHLVPGLTSRVIWLDHLPQQAFNGIILANEVLDAMPVECFRIAPEGFSIRHVSLEKKQLVYTYQPLEKTDTHPIYQQCLGNWANAFPNILPKLPYDSEFNPSLPAWINSLEQILNQGMVLLIDYGYERTDYYRPERNQGTLLCHYQHQVHDNPLLWPGLQDITASVDFTAVAEAAEQCGLRVAGYTTQADFLINAGLEIFFTEALNSSPGDQYALAQQVRLLTLPNEMGERFKAMALTKGFTLVPSEHKLCGFKHADHRHRLYYESSR